MNDTFTDSSESRRLLDDLSDGSAKAFNDLFARHRSYLRRIIDMYLDDRLRRRVDASDIVQETHMETVRRLDEFLRDRPVAFRVWLRQIAHERLIMARRRHIKSQQRSVTREIQLPEESSQQLMTQLAGNKSTPSDSVQRREMAERMRQVIGEMPDADRELLLMRYVEGLNNQEIAFVLNVETNTISKRHGRALIKLRQMLADRGWIE